MSTLWAFGDSFTSVTLDENNNLGKLIKLKNNPQFKSWAQILANNLNYELKDLGKGGNSNYQIFQDYCDNCHLINKDDIVIIGWGLLDKFRIAFNNNLVNVHPNGVNGYPNFKKESLLEIIKNRNKAYMDTQYNWANEIYSWENGMMSLAKIKGYKIYFWSTEENRLIYDKPDSFKYKRNYLCPESNRMLISYLRELGCTSIDDESNGLIGDSHFGIEGHKKQAEIFYNQILKFNI
jgi:hypothetical protein